MKKLLTFIFALCFGFFAMAQDVIMYDFNDSTQFEDWTVVENPEDTVGGYNWRYDDDMGVVYSIVNLGNTPDFRIVSPEFDVSDFDISASFLFAIGSYSSSRTARASISVYVIIDDMEYPRLQYNLVDSMAWVWYCDTISNMVDLGILDLENNQSFRVAIEFNSVSNSNALVMIDDFKFHMRDDVALLHFVGPEDGGKMEDVVMDTAEYFFAPAPEYDLPDGCVFLFWHVEDMNDNVYLLNEGDSVWVSGDMIWYAQWGYEYTVSYSINDGSDDEPDVEDAIQYLGHTVLDMGYTREHYKFGGYNTAADGSGTSYSIGDSLDLETDINGAVLSTEMWLYAQWIPINVTIHYEANGGQGVMADTAILEESDFDVEDCRFYRTGYGFDHWNTEADDSGTDYEAGETINTSDNITLYAQWTTVPTITISFDLGDAPGSTIDTVFNSGYDFVIPDYQVTYFAHSFAGWKVNGQGEVYHEGDVINYSDDVTLVAVWDDLPMVSISFSADATDAVGTMNNAIYPASDNYTIPACSFTRRGYTFVGWYEQTADTLYHVGDVVLLPEGTYTLSARWNALPTVRIVFDANSSDAIGAMSDMVAYLDSVVSLPECAFQLEGFFFTGWNTKADGTGTNFDDLQQVSFSTDTTLYAQWEEIPIVYHSISFNANGGVGSMNSVEVEDSRVFALPECSFTREGYTFAGWCTDANGNGDTLAVGEEYYVGQDRTFYAVWIAEETEGIANLSMTAMTIGPNPATAMVSVSGVNVNRLTIFSVNGQRLRIVNATSSISLDGLPTGVYMLQVNAAEGTAMRRIVKK